MYTHTCKNKKLHLTQGSLLIEVIIVGTIVSTIFMAALSVVQKSISLTRQSLHSAEAAFLLEEGAEVTRLIRDTAWSQISALVPSTTYYLNFNAGTWSFSTTPSSVGIFTRTIVVTPAYRDMNQNLALSGTLDDQTKFVTVTVSWVEGDQLVTKNLQFYITDLFTNS